MNDWKWFGNAGHFICSRNCQFHLCTQVKCYLVSTVGQLWLDRSSREIHASVYDPKWLSQNIHLKGDNFDDEYMKKFGYEEIGYGRLFETMVFKAGKPCSDEKCACGLPEIEGYELDSAAYNTTKDATAGHLEMCKKWEKELNA